MTATHLVGEWRSTSPHLYHFQVYEAAHEIRNEPWGGYTRHNVLRRRRFNEANEQVDDQFIAENHAIRMYQPLLPAGGKP